jgi:hypothetical protein
MRPLLCGLLLTCVAGLAPTSKADTFEFTFVSLNGLIAGTGTIGTLPYDTDPDGEVLPLLQGYFVTSLGGEVNGIPIVPLPGLTSVVNNFTNAQAPLNVPLIPYQQFDVYLAFTLDGYETYIVDSQGGPFAGLTFINPGDVAGLSSDEIAMQLVDVAYSAPEPGSLALLGLGFLGLAVFARSRRSRSALRFGYFN